MSYGKPASAKPYTLIYSSIDGVRKTHHFATLDNLRRKATYFVGEHPDLGSYYAVSFDGVGKIEVRGISIRELFEPEEVARERATAELERQIADEIKGIAF